MKIQPDNGKARKDNSLAFFHAEAASASVENAGIAYQSPSVIATGADASGVAFLSTMTNLVLSVLLIKVPSLIEGRQNSLKRTFLILGVVSAVTWLPIILALYFFTNVSPLFLTALWIVNLVPTVLFGPLRDSWLANLVPSHKMGRYLSWRSAIAGAFYLASFYLMGYVLDITTGQKTRGYALILAFAFLASAFSVLMYTRIRAPSQPAKTDVEVQFGLFNFLKQARKSHLGTFILFISMFTFAVNLAGPLFSSYMLNDLKFSYMTFSVIVSCEYIARIISLAFWGKIVDKSGSLKILGLVTYFIPLVPIFWLFNHSLIYLASVQMFSGVVWSAFDLSVQTFIFKATTPEHRLRYIVYYRSLTSFSVALGAITGGLLLHNMFYISGSQILSLFLVSGVLRMVVARIMLPKMTPEGIPGAVIHQELAVELEAARTPVFGEALYYHPEAWSRFTNRAYIIGNSIGRTIGRLTPSQPGLYYHPENWSWFGKQPNIIHRIIDSLSPFRQGLYYTPQKWGDYMGHNPDLQPVRVNIEEKQSRSGLFYNQQAWQEYVDRAVGDRALSTHADTQPLPARDGLYFHQDAWNEYQQQLAAEEAKESRARQKVAARNGLFQNPQHWAEYLKQSLLLNATTMRSGGESLVLRQPVFYHPEAWEKYKEETTVARTTRAHEPASREPLLYHPEEWGKYEAHTNQRQSVRVAPAVGATPATIMKTPQFSRQAHAITTRASNPVKTIKRPVTHSRIPDPPRRLRTSPALA